MTGKDQTSDLVRLKEERSNKRSVKANGESGGLSPAEDFVVLRLEVDS